MEARWLLERLYILIDGSLNLPWIIIKRLFARDYYCPFLLGQNSPTNLLLIET
jgi:hypothetical protein